jgi:hypothetical protein
MLRNITSGLVGRAAGQHTARMFSAMPKHKLAKSGKDLVLVDGVRTPFLMSSTTYKYAFFVATGCNQEPILRLRQRHV